MGYYQRSLHNYSDVTCLMKKEYQIWSGVVTSFIIFSMPHYVLFFAQVAMAWQVPEKFRADIYTILKSLVNMNANAISLYCALTLKDSKLFNLQTYSTSDLLKSYQSHDMLLVYSISYFNMNFHIRQNLFILYICVHIFHILNIINSTYKCQISNHRILCLS